MSSETKVQVRFCETDALGHVNNVSYFIYMEQARVDFMKAMGTGITTDNSSVAVVSVSCDFIGQAYFDQELKIKTYVSKIGNKSFTLKQDIREGSTNKQIALGQSVVVLLNPSLNKSLPLSDEWTGKLKEHLEV